MRFGGLWLLAVLCIVALNPATVRSESNTETTNDAPFREIMKCGPNALFLFLRLSGHPNVRLEDLQQLAVSPEGVSFLTLRDEARKFGVDAEIRRYRLQEVEKLPLPAIAEMISGKGEATISHYSVIYKVDAQRLYLVDGTTGEKLCLYLRPKMFQWWSGVAMTEKRSLAKTMMNGPKSLIGATICAAILDLIVLAFWIRRRQKSRVATTEAGAV